MLRKVGELACSCFLSPCRVCSPVRAYFHASQVSRACWLDPFATLPGLLARASFLSCFALSPSLPARASCYLAESAPRGSFLPCFASSPSLLARASCYLAGSAHPCEFTFMLRKFDKLACSCFLLPCRVFSSVRFYFDASQVRRACWLVRLATLLGLLTRARLLSCFAISRACWLIPLSTLLGLLSRASLLSCFASSPNLLTRAFATLPGLLTRASLLSYFASSPSLLTRATCNPIGSPSLLARASCYPAGSAHPYELTFMLRKLAKPAGSSLLRPYLARPSFDLTESAHPCELTFMLPKLAESAGSSLMRPYRVCSPVRAYFHASKVSRVCWIVPHATLSGLLTRASLLSCFPSSPTQFARAFATLPGLLTLSRACWLIPFATLLGLLTRASFLSCFAFSPSLPARASCYPAGSAPRASFLSCFASSPSLLARASCYPAGSAPRASFLSCFASSPSLLARAFATLPGLLARASFLSCFASSPNLLARATCNPIGSPHPCELTLLHRNFAEPTRSCFLRHCQPSLLARASYHHVGSAHPCEFTFMLCMLAEPARSCFLPPCRVCSPVRVYFLSSPVRRACRIILLPTMPGLLPVLVYFHASQVRRACSLVLLATLSGLLTRASLLSCFASSTSLLARASCHRARSAHPCELTFMLRKLAEPAGSSFLRPYRVCSPVQAYFHPLLVSRACGIVPHATLSGLLTRACLLSCFTSSPALLARAFATLPGLLAQFTFMLRKFADSARSCFLQPCRVCSPMRVYFHASQVRRLCSLVLLATLPGLLTYESLLSCFASSPSLLARASCYPAESAHPCEFTLMLRQFAVPAGSSYLQPCRARPSFDLTESAHPCELTFMLHKLAEPAGSSLFRPYRVCSPVRVYFHASLVSRACWLILLATLLGLLTHASLLSCFASSPNLLPRAFATLPGLLTLCRACWLVHLATLPGLLTYESLLSCFASSPSLLARASCYPAEFAHPCEFTLMLRQFAEPAGSSYLQPCRVCSPVRAYFHASQVSRACPLVLLATLPRLLTHAACSLVLLTTLPGLLARGSLLSCFPSSPSLLTRASCNLAESAPPCEFTFMLRMFAESARLCFLRPWRVCSPVRAYFHASQVRRDSSLMLLATLPGLLTRASLFSCFASLPSLLSRASCRHAESAHPCEFTFMLRKFAEPAPSCFLQRCRVDSPVRVCFHASQVRRLCSLVLLATLPGLLTRASLLSCFASSPGLLARASCYLAWSARPWEFTFMFRKFAEPARSCFLPPCRVCSLVLLANLAGLLTRASLLSCFASSPGLLARASCYLAWSARPWEFTFMFRKFAEPARSCFLPPCRVCSLVLLANLAGLLTRASLLSCFASSPGLLARASCYLAWSARPWEFTFMFRKFAEPARSCFLPPCRVCSLVLLANLAGLLTRASLLSCFASSPGLLARASCYLAWSARPWEFTFMFRKFAEPARSCFLPPCRVCSLVLLANLAGLLTRASLLSCFASSPGLLARASCYLAWSARPWEFTFMFRKFAEPARSCFLPPCRVCSLVLLANLAGLLTRASLLSCFASSPGLLARASCYLAWSARPWEFTFMFRKFAEPARSCFLPPCRVCSLVLLANLAGLLTRASLLSCFASSPGLLARASCYLAWSARPWEFTFMFRKFAEPARSCFLPPCRVCSLVLLANLAGLLTRASLLSCFASSPGLLARASCYLAWSARPWEFTFMFRKFAEPARSCFLPPCRVCSLVLLANLAGLLTRASLLSCFASSPGLLARASCYLAWSARPWEFTFMFRKFAEPARSCFLPPCRVCSLVLLANLAGLLTRASLLSCFASSPSLLARASCDLAGSANPCEFTFMLRKFAEPAPSCFLQRCRVDSPVRVCFHASQVRLAFSVVPLATLPVCSPVRVYFHASQVRRACWLVLLATLPGLLARASLLSSFVSSSSLLARASYHLAWSARPWEFTFMFPKFAEPAHSCFLQPCRVCSPVRVYFHASHVRRVCSLVLLATLAGLLTRASLLSFFKSSPSLMARASSDHAGTTSLLARASCHRAGSADPCDFTFMLRKLAKPAVSSLLRPYRVCSPVRAYFHAMQVSRACWLVPPATLPGLLTRVSLLSCFARSAHPCEFTYILRNFAEPAGSYILRPSQFTFLLRKFDEPACACFLPPCRVFSPVLVHFHAMQVCRACWLVLPATLQGLLIRASLLSCFASSPTLLARASCNLAGSAHSSPTLLTRAFATLPGLLTRASFLSCFASSPSLPARASCYPAGSAPRASFLSCFAISPSLLARPSCDLTGSAHPCKLTFILC
ncbi:hypothetical protein CRG98_045938 [Punica granatum]|uniref:Uncharacterized protein n=1 Tax=Punica granatum TaxID=22663 RepID=A0A2I0HPP6_PUNGR|nr:hypothetical protein CRG98_045938 [Punica granatum]